MKIIHIITTIELGGAEKQLVVLARNQKLLGNEVYVLYLKGSPELLNDFKKSGIKVLTPIPYTNLFSYIFHLRRLIGDLKFDVIHAHLPRSEIVSFLLCIFSNRKFIVSRHNAEPFFPQSPTLISKILSRIITSRSFHVISISKAVQTYLFEKKEISISQKNSIVYYGYDESSPSNIRHIDTFLLQNRFRILFVGRIVKQKNLITLLEAFRQHRKTNPYSELHIYGIGELTNVYKENFRDLEKCLFWHGKTPNIAQIMSEFDVLVLPSNYEGFGLVLLEAMRASLPIIAANNSAIPEVLGTNYLGLFQTRNSVDLQSKLDLFSKSSSLLFEISSELLSRSQLFSPNISARRINAIYSDLISGS